MNNTFVKDVMSEKILTVNKSMSIQESAQKMKVSNIGCVMVVDNDTPIGIVSERDFVTKIAAEGIPLFTEICEVMSQPLITVNHDETIWEASEIMKSKGIHKLPVKENGKIVGIITTTDIVKISSVGSDSQMRKICDQILMRISDK